MKIELKDMGPQGRSSGFFNKLCIIYNTEFFYLHPNKQEQALLGVHTGLLAFLAS